MSEHTIRHLLADGTSEDHKVDVPNWRMFEVQSVYPTKVRFDDISSVRIDDTWSKEWVGNYRMSYIKQDFINNPPIDPEPVVNGVWFHNPRYDGVWDFDKLLWWIWEMEQSMKVKRGKTSFYIQPEQVISGVVPDGDWWVPYNEWSENYLGQLEIVEGDGKVHRGVFGYKADDYLKPSASVIEEKLKPYGEWKQSNNIGEWKRDDKDLTWMHQEMVNV